MNAIGIDEQSIFEVARKIDSPMAREAYLAQICAHDAAIEQRVRALLKAYEESVSFLETSPAASNGDDAILERPGSVIGPYKLMEQIGEGGMGLVFVAEQQHPIRRKVAIKLIKPGMDSREVIARFEAERQALALMEHPNIARVFDAGATELGRPYFVMELVRGVNILQYCDNNRLAPRERLALFIDVCQAVQHAHQKGIIHRDLKATNILVTLHDGTPVIKVIDFGVAKAIGCRLTDKTIYTRFAQMIGTPMYMSPEQAELSGLDIDTRSDIYALGVLLYELLTGATPFDEERLKIATYDEIRRIVREEEPPKPSRRVSTLVAESLTAVSSHCKTDPKRLSRLFRGELDWIVMKSLEKNRNRRYETASAFAADVQRYLNGEPVLACPPTTGYRLRKMIRRNRGAAWAISLVLLALVLGIIGTTWSLLRATHAEADAINEANLKTSALTDKESALELSVQSEKDAKEKLWLSLYEQARARRYSRQMGQRFNSLAALEKAAKIHPDERLRDEAIAAMALPDIRRGATFDAKLARLGFDAHYQTYAEWDDRGAIIFRRIPDNQEVRRIETKGNVASVWVSPNGKFVAAIDEEMAIQLWRVADGEPILEKAIGPCKNVAFSPDSRQMAVAREDWIHAIDVASGKETRRWQLPAHSHSMAFDPISRRLALSYTESEIVSIYDSVEGKHLSDLTIGLMNFATVAWHPDGLRLAVGGSDPRIQIWEVAAKRKLAILTGHVQQITYLSFHPDGGLLASGSWDGSLRLWEPATGRQLMQLSISAAPRFSSTGILGYVWQGGEQLQLLEVNPGREYRTMVSSLGAGRGFYQDGSISPDGRLLALAIEEGDRLWDLATGRELAVLPTKSRTVLFRPDASALITCGPRGLRSWPMLVNPQTETELSFGPSRKIALPFAPHRIARSRDGNTLAVVSEDAGAGVLLDIATESVLQRFKHPQATEVALSSDGQWMASCGWQSDRVRLWNAKTGAMRHEWILGKETGVFFTPDSRSLIISRGDAFTFWDVATLKPVRRLDRDVRIYPGHVAFSHDGKLMALEMAPAVIQLREVATGRIVAKLEDPHGDRAQWMGFSPDGTQLVVSARFAKAIHVWDLRAIRTRLKQMGLDWEWPEFEPVDPKARVVAIQKVEVLPGDLPVTREERARADIAECRRDLELNPNSAVACNELAWIYLTGPLALRNIEAAVPLAEKAVRLAGKETLHQNTLGVAYYRARRYREAVDVLRPNIDKEPEKYWAFDLYFLAMSYHRLGESERAKDYLAWAVRWSGENRGLQASQIEELKEFRVEAEELLNAKKGTSKEK